MSEEHVIGVRFTASAQKSRAVTMNITSPAFENNTTIPKNYTCDGENVSPPLRFSDVPKNTKSLALIVDDPDAVSKVPWIHWVVYGIDPATTEVFQNSIPKGGILGMTDFGKRGYGGPCPPSGTHRYFFKLYALDTLLILPEGVDVVVVEQPMQGHILASAQLVGLYKRT